MEFLASRSSTMPPPRLRRRVAARARINVEAVNKALADLQVRVAGVHGSELLLDFTINGDALAAVDLESVRNQLVDRLNALRESNALVNITSISVG